ncbi:hypothetical protein [Streptomyces lichenis]|uniref:Uncharacterized protein n=1 Tax=Streptomyces lichenis TaxID=2306967 RepID=A0ABT0ICR8_9ACTN|nr:hypothetical protein [Streptomyces lichenis]MCK8679118.1 hypothetical protein [Streptomyces lichenis]
MIGPPPYRPGSPPTSGAPRPRPAVRRDRDLWRPGGIGLLFPLWLGSHADLLLGVEAQLTCALVGTESDAARLPAPASGMLLVSVLVLTVFTAVAHFTAARRE